MSWPHAIRTMYCVDTPVKEASGTPAQPVATVGLPGRQLLRAHAEPHLGHTIGQVLRDTSSRSCSLRTRHHVSSPAPRAVAVSRLD